MQVFCRHEIGFSVRGSENSIERNIIILHRKLVRVIFWSLSVDDKSVLSTLSLSVSSKGFCWTGLCIYAGIVNVQTCGLSLVTHAASTLLT